MPPQTSRVVNVVRKRSARQGKSPDPSDPSSSVLRKTGRHVESYPPAGGSSSKHSSLDASINGIFRTEGRALERILPALEDMGFKSVVRCLSPL